MDAQLADQSQLTSQFSQNQTEIRPKAGAQTECSLLTGIV